MTADEQRAYLVAYERELARFDRESGDEDGGTRAALLLEAGG